MATALLSNLCSFGDGGAFIREAFIWGRMSGNPNVRNLMRRQTLCKRTRQRISSFVLNIIIEPNHIGLYAVHNKISAF